MNTAAERIVAWRADPLQFVRENFHAEPDRWQAKTLSRLPKKPGDKVRISMQACAGPGKSALLAWVGWWMLSCWGHKGGHPKGSAVSINRDNLRDNLWAELSRWQSESKFLMEAFEWTKERISSRDHPETWFLAAKTYSRDADKDAQGRVLSGQHSPYTFYLIDESGDINPAILKAAEQGMSNCDIGLIIQAGNCTSHEGMLYQASKDPAWDVVSITADPDDPDRTPRVDAVWARAQIEKFGRNDPWVMAYILGQFPPTSLHALLSREDVEAAMGKHLTPDKYETSQKRIGVDVARDGLDMTVLFPRQGLWAQIPVEMRGARSNEVADQVIMGKTKWGSELEMVDATGGYGSGVCDSMIQRGYTPIEVQFAATAPDDGYFNMRAYIWWQMAQWVKRGGALPRIPQLMQELTTVQYGYQNGKLKIEDKEKLKARLGFSPDYADALACTFAIPERQAANVEMRVPGVPVATSGRVQGVGDAYDPFHDA